MALTRMGSSRNCEMLTSLEYELLLSWINLQWEEFQTSGCVWPSSGVQQRENLQELLKLMSLLIWVLIFLTLFIFRVALREGCLSCRRTQGWMCLWLGISLAFSYGILPRVSRNLLWKITWQWPSFVKPNTYTLCFAEGKEYIESSDSCVLSRMLENSLFYLNRQWQANITLCSMDIYTLLTSMALRKTVKIIF